MNEKEQKQLDRKLYEAASEVKFEEVKELIKKGANVNRKFTYEGTSLHAVAPRYHKDDAAKILQYLIDNGGDVNLKATGGETPLGAAVGNVNLKAIDILLKNGADINLKGEKGRTPLNVLVSSSWRRDDDRCLEITKTLVEAGADINIKDKEKKTPYLNAILEGFIKTANYLKKLGSKDIKLFITTNSYDGEERMYIDKKNIPDTIEGYNVDLIGEGTLIIEEIYLPNYSYSPIGFVKTKENKYYFCWLPDFYSYNYGAHFTGRETSEKELKQFSYFSDQFVDFSSNSLAYTPQCTNYNIVRVQKLNVRDKPGKPSNIVGVLSKGDNVCIYDFSGKQGRTDRKWVSGKYLSKSVEN